MSNNVPIFPLNTVLFPDGILPLRIFEPRYLDMVSESMRNRKAFGICLITEGNEAGTPAACHEIGTLARITDWDQGQDGLLQITVKGGNRFQIINRRVRNNKLIEADIRIIDDADDEELPVEYQLLSDLLQQIADKYKIENLSDNLKYLDANWVGCRLSEILPFELNEKQSLLEIDNPVQRLSRIQSMLQDLSSETNNL